MGKLYRGQSALRLCVRTFTDMNGIAAAAIKYRKPDGATNAFAAVVADAEQGIISYELSGGELDQSGWWVFWAAIEYPDGRSAAGEATRVFIWEEGAGA